MHKKMVIGNLYNVSRETFNERFKYVMELYIQNIFEYGDFEKLSYYFENIGKIFQRIDDFLNDVNFVEKSKYKCNFVMCNDDITYNVTIWDGYTKVVDFDLMTEEWTIVINEKNGLKFDETFYLSDFE